MNTGYVSLLISAYRSDNSTGNSFGSASSAGTVANSSFSFPTDGYVGDSFSCASSSGSSSSCSLGSSGATCIS